LCATPHCGITTIQNSTFSFKPNFQGLLQLSLPSPIANIDPQSTMGVAFDYAPERPESIQLILNGLDRYNPETTTVFQDYVMSQCENKTYDCYANLALLKLYVSSLLLPIDDEQNTNHERPNEIYLLALSDHSHIYPRHLRQETPLMRNPTDTNSTRT